MEICWHVFIFKSLTPWKTILCSFVLEEPQWNALCKAALRKRLCIASFIVKFLSSLRHKQGMDAHFLGMCFIFLYRHFLRLPMWMLFKQTYCSGMKIFLLRSELHAFFFGSMMLQLNSWICILNLVKLILPMLALTFGLSTHWNLHIRCSAFSLK